MGKKIIAVWYIVQISWLKPNQNNTFELCLFFLALTWRQKNITLEPEKQLKAFENGTKHGNIIIAKAEKRENKRNRFLIKKKKYMVGVWWRIETYLELRARGLNAVIQVNSELGNSVFFM